MLLSLGPPNTLFIMHQLLFCNNYPQPREIAGSLAVNLPNPIIFFIPEVDEKKITERNIKKK